MPEAAASPSSMSTPKTRKWKRISIGFLILFVVTGAALAWTLISIGMSLRQVEESNARIRTLQQELDHVSVELEGAQEQVPFIYVDQGSSGIGEDPEIKVVDRVSGEERVLPSNGESVVKLVAVPQRHYDGRIFVTFVPDETDFVSEITAVDVETGERTLTGIDNLYDLVSPDQEKVITLVDGLDERADLYNEKQLLVYDLLTDEIEVLGELGQNEYFDAGSDGIEPFPTVFVHWRNTRCAQVAVYEDVPVETDAEEDGLQTERVLKEQRIMCLN